RHFPQSHFRTARNFWSVPRYDKTYLLHLNIPFDGIYFKSRLNIPFVTASIFSPDFFLTYAPPDFWQHYF
ncbi:MAG: hypothetical protein MRZ59_13345, partial [Clostridiales bacterium]|nr:hypothetical protein [Clostridiales bacterium]